MTTGCDTWTDEIVCGSIPSYFPLVPLWFCALCICFGYGGSAVKEDLSTHRDLFPNFLQLALMVGYNLSSSSVKPGWLESLLTEKFFIACLRHAILKKNERNIFCVDCSDSICQHCLPNHRSHKLLQVRRYVYHDVIRLQDIQKLVDCSYVQTYIINSARVVFLNQRPQPRPSKGLANACETCERSLQDTYRYCSVACKVDAVVKNGEDISNLLPQCNSLHLSELLTVSPIGSSRDEEKADDEELSPNSILEEHGSQTSSGSTANDGDGVCASTATTLPPPKRVRSTRPLNSSKSHHNQQQQQQVASTNNRRKGTPHRSPLF